MTDELIQGSIKIAWSRLGEGRDGDYDPSDPQDVEFLRYDCSILEDDEWNPISDASYCTNFPATATPSERRAGLQHLMTALYPLLARNDGSHKRLAQQQSHLTPDDIRNQAATTQART